MFLTGVSCCTARLIRNSTAESAETAKGIEPQATEELNEFKGLTRCIEEQRGKWHYGEELFEAAENKAERF